MDSGHVWTKISASSVSFFTDVDTTNPSVVKFTLMDGTVLSVMRTDNVLAQLFGKVWQGSCAIGYSVFSYCFHEDYTYDLVEQEGGVAYSNTFEYVENDHMLILHRDGSWNTVVKIISLDEYSLRLLHVGGHVDSYYWNGVQVSSNQVMAPQEGGTFTLTVEAHIPLRLGSL